MLLAVVLVLAVTVGAVGTALWFSVGRDQLVTDLAVGTWSCRGLSPRAEQAVQVYVGDGTFAIPEDGWAGTWTFEDGRFSMTITENPGETDDRRIDAAGLPERATPSGTALLTSPILPGTLPLQWSYQDGRVVFSAPGGRLVPGDDGAPEPVGECTKVG